MYRVSPWRYCLRSEKKDLQTRGYRPRFVVTYKGKPRGNAIKGAVDYDFDGQTGSVDFEGKLVREAKKKDKEKSAGKKGKKATL